MNIKEAVAVILSKVNRRSPGTGATPMWSAFARTEEFKSLPPNTAGGRQNEGTGVAPGWLTRLMACRDWNTVLTMGARSNAAANTAAAIAFAEFLLSYVPPVSECRVGLSRAWDRVAKLEKQMAEIRSALGMGDEP